MFILAGITYPLYVVLFVLIDILGIHLSRSLAYSIMATYWLAVSYCIVVLRHRHQVVSKWQPFYDWVCCVALIGAAVGFIDAVRLAQFTSANLGPLVPWPENTSTFLRRLDVIGLIQFPLFGFWVIVTTVTRGRRYIPGLLFGALQFLVPVFDILSLAGMAGPVVIWLFAGYTAIGTIAGSVWFLGRKTCPSY